MKLSEWPHGFDYPGITEQIAARLVELDATEDAALLIQDDDGNPRALIATDVALLDCRFVGQSGPAFEMRAVPWDAVPVPWITFAWFGSPDTATMTFRLDLERPASTSFEAGDAQRAAQQFYSCVLRRRRR